jgi:predicted acetyltransferase
MVKLRHYLNDSLRQHGGHIGYALAPNHRGKGYGNKMLELALLEAKNLGIEEVLLVCNPGNLASRAVIIKNGGRLEQETAEDALYWI